MSKYRYEMGGIIRDVEMDFPYHIDEIIELLDEKDQKISDLEAKLAESEKDRLMWQEMYKSADRQNKEICETDIYPLQEENQQLKQQLAESETRIEELESQFAYECECNKQFVECQNENAQLKQQLAEKEAEIEKWKSMAERSSNLLDRYNRTGEIENQDKISFAVEQLEQLKHDIWTDQQDDGWLDEQVDIYFLTETIDNQIKRLTHQHEDKGE